MEVTPLEVISDDCTFGVVRMPSGSYPGCVIQGNLLYRSDHRGGRSVMTEEDVFLQAILERPDDDLTRMVYGDWLSDRGDPRGEFIHIQCLLAQTDEDDVRRHQLKARERELLGLHQDGWLGPVRSLLSR